MTTRAKLVAEALTWVGTPWHRNQSRKGVGADCVGVVAGIAMACGIQVSSYRNNYSQQPDGTLIPELKREGLVPVKGELKPGDVLVMSFANVPHHIALYIGTVDEKIGPEIVHAYLQVRRCVRCRYDEYWKRKVQLVLRSPLLTE